MSDPSEDDPLAIIETTRARLQVEARPERIERQPERRISDRRGLGYTARRQDDREWSHQVRAVVSAYLHHLPEETRWNWIDGWLGTATDEQLVVLLKAVQESAEADRRNLHGPRRRGRPRKADLIPTTPTKGSLADHPVLIGIAEARNVAIREEWQELRKQLKALSHHRQRHDAPMNRNRLPPRSLKSRRASLASPIGQRLNRAGLFTAFFNATEMGPGEMAARLLRREREQQLATFARHARQQAARARSTERREALLAQGTQANALLKTLPSWRTLFDTLSRRAPRASTAKPPKTRSR